MNTDSRLTPPGGQSGPPLELPIAELNNDELKVCEMVWKSEGARTIDEIARQLFKLKPTAAKANSRVRNALRRTVRASFLERAQRGAYRPGSRAPARPIPQAAAQTPLPAGATPGAVTLQQIEDRVTELLANAPKEIDRTNQDTRKLALVMAAAEVLGARDTAIARLTGLSRGSVIRRIKALKEHLPVEPTPGFWRADTFCGLLSRFATS